jgi:outer membrane autotransporter protein
LIFNEYTNINPSRLPLNIAAPTNPAYQYSESASSTGNGASYVATYSVNITASFVPPGYALTRNETALAQELQSIWDAGSAGNPNPAYTTLFTSLARTTSATYPTSLDNLTSEFGAAAVAAVPAAAQSSATALMSCPGFEGISASLREEDCAWARTIGNWSNDAASNGFSGYRMSGVTTQIGGQRRVADGWFVGGLFGYGFNTYNANSGRENANGQEGTLGLVIKHQIGNWVFAAAVAGGWGSEKATRTISLPGLSAQASSGPGNDFILGRLRSYYEFAFQQWYVRPGVDLDVIRVHNPSYSETGAGALDLSFADASKTIFSATPGFEVGGRVDLGNGTTLRPYLNAGVSLLSSDSFKGSARLAAAPSAPPFSVSAPIPDKVGHVNLGVDLMQINAMEVKLEYGIDFANRYTNQTASLRLAYKF